MLPTLRIVRHPSERKRLASAFTRSLRSIERAPWRTGAWFGAAALVVLVGWGAWAHYARVPLYAASASARLVSDRAVHPISSEVAGRVSAVHARLADRVAVGDVLVEIDATASMLEQDEQRARLESLTAQLTELRVEIAARERALEESAAVDEAALREARTRIEVLVLGARVSADESERTARLQTSGNVSELDVSKARASAQKDEFSLAAQRIALEREGAERVRAHTEREASLAAGRRTLSELEGGVAGSTAAIARMEHEIDLRRLRAPADGEIGEWTAPTPGTYVQVGERLGVILSAGNLKVDARFSPSAALGRVQPGARGTLRLDAYPWMQYGAIPISVVRISSEARDGTIEVEFALDDAARARMPLEHGLPGSVQVEVDRVTPIDLLLRAVGGSKGVANARPGTTPAKAD